MRRKLPPKDPDRRHSVRIADFINAIGQTRSSGCFRLEDAAVFGCAVVTGVGAVVNTANVPVGSAVAVIGLGGVGLSAVLGARIAGAAQIVT
jgi:Zn-dependent alcohol dehydrogenase